MEDTNPKLQKVPEFPAGNGPGWAKLSEKTYMCSSQPLRSGKTVYKGKHWLSGEWIDVAVKVMPFDEDKDKEIKFHMKLEGHPNVIRLYDAARTQGIIPHIYIAMELCSQTLADFIEENKKFPFNFKQCFEFSKQIVSGVAFMHNHNVIHRDIKLENILLSSTKDSVRVADFGLSKELLDGKSFATASHRGIGSDGYRAPELLRDNPKASFRSDSFSVGIVLGMLFSNSQHPYGPDPARWRTNIMDNRNKDLSKILEFKEPYVHKRARLLDLIECCLHPIDRRRPTPAEMLQFSFFTSKSEHLLPTKSIGTGAAAPSTRVDANTVAEEPIVSKSTSLLSDEKQSCDKEAPHLLVESAERSTTQLPTYVKSVGSAASHISAESTERIASHLPTEMERIDSAGPLEEFLTAKKKRIEALESDLAKSLRNGRIERYAQILQDLKTLQNTDDLEVAIQLAEYEFMSKKNESPIRKLRDHLSSTRSRSSLQITNKGLELHQQGQHVQAFILFKIGYDLHKEEPQYQPDVELRWIADSVRAITTAADPLFKLGGWSREIAKNYGLRYTEEMLSELREVNGASPGVKALHEMGCIVNITGNSNEIQDNEKTIKYGEEGVALMQREFGDSAVYYQSYGAVLNNLGNAYKNTGQQSKAEFCYATAIEVHMKALDYDDDETRQEHIRKTNANLGYT